jgi:hypothetical protein
LKRKICHHPHLLPSRKTEGEKGAMGRRKSYKVFKEGIFLCHCEKRIDVAISQAFSVILSGVFPREDLHPTPPSS